MTLPELHRHVADHIAHAGQPATEFTRGWDAAYINVGNALRGLPVETCLCAALLMPDGYIVRGHRHDDCYITIGFYRKPGTTDALYDKGQLHQAIQGFLTTQGRFVDRVMGMTLQKAAGVPSAHSEDGVLRGQLLFSEDLY